MTMDRDKLLERLRNLSDYPAIRDVANALWGVGEIRGAAVMVGSGFSRNADLAAGDSILPPLWSDFARRMAADLYPTDSGKQYGDPLRLAEEYRAALGQPALDSLIRDLVPDQIWMPGPLHRELLRLPWADVLTTNWDTLLERAAAEDHERAYEVVETVDAIARTRAPRIVKLHGSLPSHGPFIFTEEDFRTYPDRYPPFVNLAQQALLENELVLIGFSGDDPNFLRWAGWVRDQLGVSARRIRLVGVLNLTSSRRRLLEGQNVTPIDLGPLVDDIDQADRHRVATEIFIEALKAHKPRPAKEWCRPSNDLEGTVAEEKLVAAWAEDRRNYPGWLVAPQHQRRRVRMATDGILSSLETGFPSLPVATRARLAVELAWRSAVTLTTLPPWLVGALPAIIKDPNSGLSRADRLALHIARAEEAKYRRDAMAFEGALEAADREAQTADDSASIAYERCLWARDHLDYSAVEKNLGALSGSDPAWALRRSAMLAFLRDAQGAAEAARDALFDIRARRARDRRSLWLLSREAWAHLVVRNASYELRGDPRIERDHWPSRYREADADPWDQFSNFDFDLEQARSRKAAAEAAAKSHFSPGAVYQRRRGARSGNDGSLTLFDELLTVIDRAGFARMPNVDVVERRLEGAALLLGDDPHEIWSILLTVSDREGGLISQRFNRVEVARLPEAVALEMIAALKTAIDFGRARLRSQERSEDGELRYSKWPDRIRTLVELLSRIAVRLAPDTAIDLFRWACALAHDPAWDHWWLFEPLDHLLDRLLDAVPPSRRGELATDILNFPLPDEKAIQGIDRHWPEIAERLTDNGVVVERVDPLWRDRIVVVTSLARSSNRLTRSRALIVLYALHKQDVLTDAEKTAAADAIWSVGGDSGDPLPGGVDLLPHIFLDLPEPAKGVAAKAFRDQIVTRALGSAAGLDGRSIAAATEAAEAVRLTEDEARTLSTTLLAWRPRPIDPNDGFGWQQDRDEEDFPFDIAGVMARAVLPAMAESDIDDAFVERLLASFEGIGPEMVEVLPGLARRRAELSDRCFLLLRRALVSRSVEAVYPAARAAFQWVKGVKEGKISLPIGLPSEVVTMVANRREPALRPALSLATHLVAMNVISDPDLERLTEALEVLEVETAYGEHEESGLRTDTLTLVRASCVRLASALAKAGRVAPIIDRWTAIAATDPIPEVRFALEIADD